MSRIPDTTAIKNRFSVISPKPNVYVGLKVFMWVLAPWKWRKKLLTIIATLDLSDMGLPCRRKELINELLSDSRLSLSSSSPDRFDALINAP
jgi:hypothetical protein